jgi:hypothetical protein
VLRSRWFELRKWLQERSLPDLHRFLNYQPEEFYSRDPQMDYAAGWSLFQLLMSTPANRRALNGLVLEYQKPALKPPDCAELLNQLYPGGLVKMNQDWRGWIVRGAANVLGTP